MNNVLEFWQKRAKEDVCIKRIVEGNKLYILSENNTEITDIEAVQLLIDTQASKEVFAKTFADMITDYDTCIVCKFKENEFTEAFKINSQLAILFL